ncbi:septal ring lytic transglycosylase RlpA family protein [Aliihoeflea sp. 40Bstr573]|uniref:septal ring lytic transglycosylase RlpA family protein n=1 Tax=Aliihoeflea sp. 40Bstr573 TaxID=2696467 RepID=UPI0020941774|nr:septal ring lytic transglycosylase RlpA family protein [Aliihoeflea sp. 40Bstr573]MCO6386791.1 septal ring lytic transglycosylase RlpA family protein [Aliihoeflea sp. 40Bstr573]
MFHSKAARAVMTASILALASGFSAQSPALANDKIEALQTITGSASWYGGQFHGRTTANGERYDMNELTAAHKTLPFGTKVRVTNERNGKAVVVRINDRGPFVGKRVIDLSRGAAQAVGMIDQGVARVKIEVL